MKKVTIFISVFFFIAFTFVFSISYIKTGNVQANDDFIIVQNQKLPFNEGSNGAGLLSKDENENTLLVPTVPVTAPRIYDKNDKTKTETKKGLVPCGMSGGPPCTFCHFFVLIQNIVNFLVVDLMPPLAVLFLLIGGVLLFTSGGSPSRVNLAKEIFIGVIIGVAIILISFVLISTLLKALAGENAEKYFSLKEGGFIIKCPIESKKPGTGTGGEEPESPTQPSEPTEPTTGGEPKFQGPLIKEQWEDASTPLKHLINCMYGKDSNMGFISSISDSKIRHGTCDPNVCRTCLSGSMCPSCSHHCGSCHYGGRYCKESYAVDIVGDNERIKKAARSCDSQAYVLDEGNHVHVSLGNKYGCGCN